MLPNAVEADPLELFIMREFGKEYINFGNITGQLKLSHYGVMLLKLAEINDDFSHSHVTLLEVMREPKGFLKEHLQQIKRYYKHMGNINISGDYYLKPAFLEVISIDRLEDKENGASYICIMREYIDGMRMLSKEVFKRGDPNDPKAEDVLNCMTVQDKKRYYEQIVATLRYIEETEPMFHYGEITPFNLAVGRDSFIDTEKDTVKIIDTYCDRLLRSIDRQVDLDDPELLKRDSYCSKDVIQRLERVALQPFDDLWGCCLTMYSFETGKSFYDCSRKELMQQLTTFQKSPREARLSTIESKIDKKYGAESLLRQVMNSMITDASFSTSFKGLETSVIKSNRTMKQLSLPMDETQISDIKDKIEKVNKIKELVPDWQDEVRMSDKEFILEETLQEIQKDTTDDRLNEFLRRIAFTTYGRKVKYVERENDGLLTCKGIVIYPDGENEVRHFNNEKVIRGKAYLEEHEGDAKIIKMEALFRPEGLNPITTNSHLTQEVKYIPQPKQGEEPKPEVIKMELILGYSQREVEQMVKRLTSVDIRKQARQLLESKVALYSKKYANKMLVNYSNFQHNNPHARHHFKNELVPLLSIKFQPPLVELNLGYNNLEDKDIEMMVDQNFPLFFQIERLNMTHNNLTDGALEYMRMASVRKSRPYFSRLNVLFMDHNKIKQALCFKLQHGFKKLSFVDFSHNQIAQADYDNMFRTLKSRSLVLLGGNPFVEKLKLQQNIALRQREEAERARYNVQFEEEQTMEIAEKTQVMLRISGSSNNADIRSNCSTSSRTPTVSNGLNRQKR